MCSPCVQSFVSTLCSIVCMKQLLPSLWLGMPHNAHLYTEGPALSLPRCSGSFGPAEAGAQLPLAEGPAPLPPHCSGALSPAAAGALLPP